MKYFKAIGCIIWLLCWLQPALAKGHDVTIVVTPAFNGEPLILDSGRYVTPHGDKISISLFKCYITKIALFGAEGVTGSFSSSDRLVDAGDPSTDTIILHNVPDDNYHTLAFVLGVDSIENTNGANDGDLDPAKGMYWAWNSGYIMAKIEGNSAVCPTLHHAFEFHIGGYQSPYDAAQLINIKLPVPVKPTSNIIINITADVAAWFTDNLDLAKTNSIVTPGKEASDMADRYRNMFGVVHLIQQ